jgi:hypothetical protein
VVAARLRRRLHGFSIDSKKGCVRTRWNLFAPNTHFFSTDPTTLGSTPGHYAGRSRGLPAP